MYGINVTAIIASVEAAHAANPKCGSLHLATLRAWEVDTYEDKINELHHELVRRGFIHINSKHVPASLEHGVAVLEITLTWGTG